MYRLRDDSPSEPVRILAIMPKKTSARLDVSFLDDPGERVENVPGTRLRVPWSERESFDALMANWQRISDLELDDTEQACVEEVFELLIAAEVAELQWSHSPNASLVSATIVRTCPGTVTGMACGKRGSLITVDEP